MNSHSSHHGRSQHQRSHTHATVAKTDAGASAITESIGTVRGLGAKLGLTPAENSESRKTIAAEGAIPPAFVEVGLEIASQFPELTSSCFDAAEVSAAQTRATALAPVRTAVRALLRQVEDEILREKAIVGSESRALYKYLQGIAIAPSGAIIREPLDRMAATLRKKRPAKSQAAATPPAAPQTAQADSQQK